MFYDVDTVGGSSGSPVIGRGLHSQHENQGYSVKGIHIGDALDIENINVGQNIKNLKIWIDIGKSFSDEKKDGVDDDEETVRNNNSEVEHDVGKGD